MELDLASAIRLAAKDHGSPVHSRGRVMTFNKPTPECRLTCLARIPGQWASPRFADVQGSK